MKLAPEHNPYATPRAALHSPAHGPRAAVLMAQQSLAGALLGGVLGAAVGIALWWLVVVLAAGNASLLTLLPGVTVGLAVRAAGRGLSLRYRAVAVVFAALGAAVGSMVTGLGGIYLPAMVGAALVAAGLAPRGLGRADEQALTRTALVRDERTDSG